MNKLKKMLIILIFILNIFINSAVNAEELQNVVGNIKCYDNIQSDNQFIVTVEYFRNSK